MKMLFLNDVVKVTLLLILLLVIVLVFALPAHAAKKPEVGIVTGGNLLQMDDRRLHFRLQDIKNLGATWIRVDFNWALIQPNSSNIYNWTEYDRVVKAASKKGLKILGTLTYTPVWARGQECVSLTQNEEDGQKCRPKSEKGFGKFVGATVNRYKKDGVRTWEIWNEPNLSGYWKTVRADSSIYVDPGAYAKVANAAATEIRAQDRRAIIITGGVAPMFESIYPEGMRQSDYLAKVLPKLNPQLFDAVGVHPYSWPKMPSIAADYNAFHTVDSGRPKYNLRSVMARAGWKGKQVWATEFGVSTKGERLAKGTQAIQRSARPDHVSETLQAEIIEEGIATWHLKPNVGPIFVHADSDQWLPARKNEGGFGLRRSDGTKKPAYASFQQSVRSIR